MVWCGAVGGARTSMAEPGDNALLVNVEGKMDGCKGSYH